MQLSPHFRIEEFVPKSTFNSFGVSCTWFIEPRLIKVAELLRSHFDKPIIINNWHDGGEHFESGFREPESTTGAKRSQHRFGRAIDIKIEGMSAQEIYADILKNEPLFLLAGLSAMENIASTPTWVHCDVRNIPFAQRILIVNP